MRAGYRAMRNTIVVGATLALAVGCAAQSKAPAAGRPFPDPPVVSAAAPQGAMQASMTASPRREKAVFAGGCFWGVQGVFERLKGVADTAAGYAGGSADTAFYEIVSSGTTGHAESVEVTFDPSVVSYGTLLKVFFSVVCDPTELNYQGPDHGTQYRSALFYTTPEQKRVGEEYVRILDDAKVFPRPIVTQVVPFQAFYPAEEYHQHFLDQNPDYPYIVYWDLPKIAALQKTYPDLVVKKN